LLRYRSDPLKQTIGLIGQPIYVRHHSSEVRVELLISPNHV